MNDRAMFDMLIRLDRLERENRRLKILGVLGAAVLIFTLLVGGTPFRTMKISEKVNQLRANPLILVNENEANVSNVSKDSRLQETYPWVS
ncbi:MAG: hypothetical protein ACE5HC_00065 [Candidatus Binatia bacterium]